MGKFSGAKAKRPLVSAPIQTVPGSTRTHQGGIGHSRDAKSELYVLAVSSMVGEDTFYEGASVRDERFRALVRQISIEDPAWVARLVPYLRNDMLMRSASIVVAAEYASVRKGLDVPSGTYTAKQPRVPVPVAPSIRSVVDSACQRADEPAEFIGYWLARNGRNIPSAVKRGLSDAAARLYTEYAALKYDGGSRSVRMGDVIELCHPTPGADWQGHLYRWLLDVRHGRENVNIPASLPMIRHRAYLEGLPVKARRELVSRERESYSYENSVAVSEFLKAGGMTWEALSGWLQGPMDAPAWESVLPNMGYMATLRNLRNFDEAGVSAAVKAQVAVRLADPEQVAKSKQFPFRFLSAYKAVGNSLHWVAALETALNYSLANVPVLTGRTLILVDWSGSMFPGMSKLDSGGLSLAEKATLFGAALALRADDADIYAYGTSMGRIALRQGQSLLPVLSEITNLGGTNTPEALRTALELGHHYDRVLIVTDEQVGDFRGSVGQVLATASPGTKLFTWNLGGYATAQVEAGSNVYAFAGLTDKAFTMLSLLESGRSQGWPF